MKSIIATVTNDLNYDQRMHRICSSLQSNGYEVLLVGRIKKDSKPLEVRPFKQFRLKCIFRKGKLFYLEYNIRLFFFLLFKPFDILNSVDTDTLIGGGIASIIKGKARVLDAHELFSEVPELHGRYVVKFIWKVVQKFFYRKYHAFYTVSQGIAEILSENYQIDIETIRNLPLRSNHKEVTKETDEKYILYQGALNEGRGLEELIEASHEIDCLIKLAGEGDLSGKLRQMVKERNLSKKIQFLGYKTPDELKTVTQKAYLGLNLLRANSLNYYLSLANKFFDYVQAGIPSINMNFPEYSKLNDEFKVSLLIDSLEPSSIAESVNKLLKDRNLYVFMQRNCSLAAEEWNWQREEKKLLKIYDELGR